MPEKKKTNCEHDVLIEWRKYNFSEDIDIIEDRCRLCGHAFLFMRDKTKKGKSDGGV